jgi:phosphoribosylanthranilate isomerase
MRKDERTEKAMTKVKICGIRCLEDIMTINALLPDYAGFVFCPGKRQIDIEAAGALCAALDSRIKKAGVFANQDRSFIEKTRRACGLDVLQLHGDETPGECIYEGCEVWKAIRVKDIESIAPAERYRNGRILFDSYDMHAYGGSGKVFNWRLLYSFKDRERMILAGGLSPENVAAAVSEISPYAVDVSSGVETEGKKDYEKVKQFIENVRGAQSI